MSTTPRSRAALRPCNFRGLALGTRIAMTERCMSSAPTTSQAPRAAAVSVKPQAHARARERRTHDRAKVSMLVQVVSADRVASYLAENLSASGALLSDGPELPLGAELSLALKLRGDTWHVRGRVVRVQRDAEGRVAIGVVFPSLVPKVQDLIQNHVLGCLRRQSRNES